MAALEDMKADIVDTLWASAWRKAHISLDCKEKKTDCFAV